MAIAVTKSPCWPEWMDLSADDQFKLADQLLKTSSTVFNFDVAELYWFKDAASNGTAAEWRVLHRLANQQINEAVIEILTKVENDK